MIKVTADFSEKAYDCFQEIADILKVSKEDALRKILGNERFLLKKMKEGFKVILEKGSSRIEVDLTK